MSNSAYSEDSVTSEVSTEGTVSSSGKGFTMVLLRILGGAQLVPDRGPGAPVRVGLFC